MEANLTPMIDVTFLLIVFFVVVSQIVEVESEDMMLPEPTDPLTMQPSDERRVIINVMKNVADRGTIEGYKIGKQLFPGSPEGVSRMAAHLEKLYRDDPNININLRADRVTHFEWVEPAMQAVALAAANLQEPDLVARVNLVVLAEE